MRRHANVNVSSNLCICLDVFCLFLCPFLMNWGKTIVWKSGSRRGNFNAAIIEVRVCLPFNHTMPEKQKSTSTVISFSLLTCSLKLKDIPIIQGEPLMHIHKGLPWRGMSKLTRRSMLCFSKDKCVHVCVTTMTLFQGKCTQNKNCLYISICPLSLFFLCHTCTN